MYQLMSTKWERTACTMLDYRREYNKKLNYNRDDYFDYTFENILKSYQLFLTYLNLILKNPYQLHNLF